MTQTLYKTGRLQARFKKQGLEASTPLRVLPEVYKACVSYTILAKMAPSWNKAGQWLIQGRDFLTNTGCMNAVKLEVNVTGTEMYFAIQASALRLPPAKASDFGMCGNTYYDFLIKQDGRISEEHLPYAWCHVLPSMKKGKVIEINKAMPRGSVFDSYKDLKRFWKNNYGYRLPESDADITYYQVHFLPIGDTKFTYPNVCIRSRDFVMLPRVDGRPILQAVLQDLMSKVQQVCGQPLKVQPKVHYPQAGLQSAIQDPTQANLTNKTTEKKVALRNPYQLQKVYENRLLVEPRKTLNNSDATPNNYASNFSINPSTKCVDNRRNNTVHNSQNATREVANSGGIYPNQSSSNHVNPPTNQIISNQHHSNRVNHPNQKPKVNVDIKVVSSGIVNRSMSDSLKNTMSQKSDKMIPVFKKKFVPQTVVKNDTSSNKIVPNFVSKAKTNFMKKEPNAIPAMSLLDDCDVESAPKPKTTIVPSFSKNLSRNNVRSKPSNKAMPAKIQVAKPTKNTKSVTNKIKSPQGNANITDRPTPQTKNKDQTPKSDKPKKPRKPKNSTTFENFAKIPASNLKSPQLFPSIPQTPTISKNISTKQTTPNIKSSQQNTSSYSKQTPSIVHTPNTNTNKPHKQTIHSNIELTKQQTTPSYTKQTLSTITTTPTTKANKPQKRTTPSYTKQTISIINNTPTIKTNQPQKQPTASYTKQTSTTTPTTKTNKPQKQPTSSNTKQPKQISSQTILKPKLAHVTKPCFSIEDDDDDFDLHPAPSINRFLQSTQYNNMDVGTPHNKRPHMSSDSQPKPAKKPRSRSKKSSKDSSANTNIFMIETWKPCNE